MFTIIMIVVMVITIATLFSRLENNSIVRTVINSRDGPSWILELPFFPENLMRMRNFFQLQIKYVGKMMIVFKNLREKIIRLKQFRNNLNCRLYLLGNGRCIGVFPGNKFRGSYSRC